MNNSLHQDQWRIIPPSLNLATAIDLPGLWRFAAADHWWGGCAPPGGLVAAFSPHAKPNNRIILGSDNGMGNAILVSGLILAGRTKGPSL
jgi:hypothetical protein